MIITHGSGAKCQTFLFIHLFVCSGRHILQTARQTVTMDTDRTDITGITSMVCVVCVLVSSFGVEVRDFGKSWRTGLAFLALIKSIDPGLVDLRGSLSREPQQNLEEAFKIAQDSLGIPALLEPRGKKQTECESRNA